MMLQRCLQFQEKNGAIYNSHRSKKQKLSVVRSAKENYQERIKVMRIEWKNAIKFAVCMLPIAAIGGWFTGSYTYASYSGEMQQLIMEQVGSAAILCLVTALQSAIYTVICTMIGYRIAESIGLVHSLHIERSSLLPTLAMTLGCGIFFGLDYWIFGRWLPEVAKIYESGLLTKRLDNWISSVLYGGIVEELMLRLFVMSLLSFVLWKLFFRKCSNKQIPEGVFIVANIISAMLFSAGHLPATVSMFGELSPLVVIRCFVLNGGLGLMFGRLYRKYGIQYAMIGHAGAHIISKIIWLLLL